MSVRHPTSSSVIIDVTNVRKESQSHKPYLHYQSDTGQSRSEYVYVNNAFSGSLNSVTAGTYYNPPTTVIKEQYWACSKWSFAQRALALAVGILIGTVIGLVVIIITKDKDTSISGILSSPFTS